MRKTNKLGTQRMKGRKEYQYKNIAENYSLRVFKT